MKPPIAPARERFPFIRPLLLALGAGLLLLLAAAFGSGPAQAVPSTVVGTDADPTGSTATSLGPLDPCRSASIGETFQVDVYVQDVAN
ncbi:MAG TPA: hypothetical protein VFT91_04200, partial [Dehalococcoidia bacterium]|nr:hypothetical protein [Dehalococcoidia bacterium]